MVFYTINSIIFHLSDDERAALYGGKNLERAQEETYDFVYIYNVPALN